MPVREALGMADTELTRRAAFGGFAAGLAPLVPSSAGERPDITAATIGDIKAADTTNGLLLFDGVIFIWARGDFTGRNDDRNIIGSNRQDLRKGAWVRQDDTGISHRRAPRAAITSVHDKLRHLVFADEDYGVRAGASPAQNAAALQEAVNQAQVVHLPDSPDPITFSAPIVIPPNTRIVGRGSGTRLVSLGAVAFACEALDGSGDDLQAPWLEDFELFCAGSGIRFGRADGGFSDISGQQALMRARIDRVRIRRAAAGNGGSKGIEFNKCFDGLVQQCEIQGFDKGYLGRGSDLIEISGRTRISACNTLIEISHVARAPYRFGSGTRIIGCDLLAARDCYVRSNDFDLLLEGNYFEHGATHEPLTSWAFDIAVHNRARFIGNRMGCKASISPFRPDPMFPSF